MESSEAKYDRVSDIYIYIYIYIYIFVNIFNLILRFV